MRARLREKECVAGFVSGNVPGRLSSTPTLDLFGAILVVGGVFVLAVGRGW